MASSTLFGRNFLLRRFVTHEKLASLLQLIGDAAGRIELNYSVDGFFCCVNRAWGPHTWRRSVNIVHQNRVLKKQNIQGDLAVFHPEASGMLVRVSEEHTVGNRQKRAVLEALSLCLRGTCHFYLNRVSPKNEARCGHGSGLGQCLKVHGKRHAGEEYQQ